MIRHIRLPPFVRSSKLFQRIGAILLIIAATLLVYWPALRNGFVWDDTALVLRDPLIRSWRLVPEGFRHFLFLDVTGSNFYRPLQRLSFTIDYVLSAFKPVDWHFTSITIHAAAACALYALLRRWWGPQQWRWALGVALVWAVHPLHTSAVTYVSGRADPLAALFAFAGIALALAGTRASTFGAAACFLGAVLSKESGAMGLAIWLVFLAARRAERAVWIQWVAIAAVVFAIYFGLRLTAHKTPPPPPSTPASTSGEIPVLVARAVAEYAGLVIAPVTLRMERDVRDQSEMKSTSRSWQTGVGLALIAGVIGWWFCARRRVPLAAVALCAGAVAYLPISNVFALNATVAEHWLYVPSAFLFAAVTQTLIVAPPRVVRIAVVVIFAWSVWLGVRTWQRQGDWIDQRTFLMRTIADGGDSARMRVNLGTLELKEGHTDRALSEYSEALARNPSLVFAHFGRASAYARIGDYVNARKSLEQCAPGRGLDADVIQLRATLDFAEKQIDPAPAYKVAADLVPLNWYHRKRYLTALAESGHLSQAIKELTDFLDVQRFRADSWLLLANFLSRSAQHSFANIGLAEARARDVHLQVAPLVTSSAASASSP